jgi:murein DD-endopeptidase MepM/ murein hydrolase activator NlpD
MSKTRIALPSLLSVLAIGYVLPEKVQIPVTGASKADWNPKSFWFEPWGTSGVHKGIDIFGKHGTPITSTTAGLVVYTGKLPKGGDVILILGPKWRLHYFAHLDSIKTSAFTLVNSGEEIGALGDSGNAKGKPAHLHYSIVNLIPAPWAIDTSTQGYKKAFFIDPGAYLSDSPARP